MNRIYLPGSRLFYLYGREVSREEFETEFFKVYPESLKND